MQLRTIALNQPCSIAHARTPLNRGRNRALRHREKSGEGSASGQVHQILSPRTASYPRGECAPAGRTRAAETSRRKIIMIERRFLKAAECRAKGDDAKPGLEGYAAVFNQEYVLYEDTGMRWVETIKPGAFARVLKEKQDVRCLFNHDPNQVLARTENGTLVMAEDRKGLGYDAVLDSRTRVGQDVRCFVDRKDVTGCSFSFRVGTQLWREEEQDGGKMTVYTREIEEISELYDVGPVTYPAYEGTSVGARSLMHQLRDISGIAPELRSRMLARAKRDKDEDGECNCPCDSCSRCENKRSADPAGAEVMSIDQARARARALQLSL
jgi:HK97 family phage prohead protease